jgi:hypothetical protein
MNYIDGDKITLDVALSNIWDEKGKTYLRSLMRDKYLSGDCLIPARYSGIFMEYANAVNNYGFDKTVLLFCPEINSKFIDREKLHQARIQAIPQIISWNRDIIADAVAAYYNENEQFRNAYDDCLFKLKVEQCKKTWTWSQLDLFDDDILTLYSIAGAFSFKGDLLCRLPLYKEGDERIGLYVLTVIKFNRTDLFIKLFEGYDILTQFDLFSPLVRGFNNHKTGDELHDILIPDSKEIEIFLYSYLLKILDEPDMATVQAVFPMLYKNEHCNAGSLINYIQKCQNRLTSMSGKDSVPKPEIVEKIATKAACFPVQDFFPIESFQDYQRGDMGALEYTIFQRYLELVNISCRDDVLRLAQYWYRFIDCQDSNNIQSGNMVADFPILDPFIAPWFDEELLHDILRISFDSGKEEAYPYEYHWFAHFISIFLLSSKKRIVKKATTGKAIEKILFDKPRADTLAPCTITPAPCALPENILNQITEVLKNHEFLPDDESAKLLYLLHVQGCKDPEEALAFCEEAYRSIVDKQICYQLYCLALEKKQPFYLEDHLFDIPFNLFMYPILDDPAFFPVIVQSLYENSGNTYKDRREMVGKIDRLCASIINRIDDAEMRNRKEQLALLPAEIKTFFMKDSIQRAEQDTSGNHIEQYTLLEITCAFPKEWAALPEDKKEWLYKTCSIFLNTVFSKMQIGQWEPIFDFVMDAVWHVAQKGLWKGLNPLMRAFRNSKTPLVNSDLTPKHALVHEIMRFFERRDQGALEQLRRDMARDYMNYLMSDAKKKRNPRDYTPIERKEKGFDETYNEPSPLFRYAYTRALADLEVKGDRNHFYEKALMEYQENDPAPDVQDQLKKTIKRLDFLRDSISSGHHTQRLYEAFWWFRQAHLLSLGEPVNAEESRKVRIREWRERDI